MPAFHHDGHAHEGGPRPPDPGGGAAEPLGCNDDEGQREGHGDGRVARRQGVHDAGRHAEAGAREDVVLQDLGGDVGANDSAEGSPGQGGAPPGSREESDADANADEDRHGHEAGDEHRESLIVAGRPHRPFHEDRVEHLPVRVSQGGVANERGRRDAGDDADEASAELASIPAIGAQGTRRGLSPGLVRGDARVGFRAPASGAFLGGGGARGGLTPLGPGGVGSAGRGPAFLACGASAGACARLDGARVSRVGLVDGRVGGQHGIRVVQTVLHSCRCGDVGTHCSGVWRDFAD